MADTPLWQPSAGQVARANLTRFARALASDADAPSVAEGESHALWKWSVDHPEAFWAALWRFCGVIADDGPNGEPWDEVLVGGERMAPPHPVLGPRWFIGARLNFAENLLRRRDAADALVSWDEQGCRRRMSHRALYDEVARCAASLRAVGVGPGDRVAGWMPNISEAVVAMLAAASIGAIWSSCSPDFGVKGVLDRFGQIEPTVLVAADGYRYAGKEIECLPRLAELVTALPSLRCVVVVPWLREAPSLDGIPHATLWNAFVHADEAPPPLAFARLPFDHPLFVMYSSGTTGLPKAMVHGAGGTLLQHLKEHALHTDLGRDDRLFYFTTCGWMMWNWLVSALAVEATLVLFDGAPLAPHPTVLWDMAAAERVTVFGTSAKYLALSEKAGLRPRETHNLSAMSAMLSTGSPLAAHSYEYVQRDVGPTLRLSSISGGTDIISCFALGDPTGPVWRGELQMRGLGMAVDVWDAEGRPVVGMAGELVCTRPFPSMPVAFWNDPDGAKYRAAYFEHYPGVWRHGDWAELTSHDGLVIHGRSDATLNPGGVRIGTAEIYRQVEQLPEIVEAVVIGQEVHRDGDPDVRIVLFVRLRDGLALDDALRTRIARHLRETTSPHHVPKKIVQVSDIPRTISGKITEMAVRDVVHGRTVANVDALANPAALELFRNLAELSDAT